MSKHNGALSAVAAQFFSDTHALHIYNGGAERHLQKIFTSAAQTFYYVGDMLDFEYVSHALQDKGMRAAKFPVKFEKVLQKLANPEIETHLRVFDAIHYQADRGRKSVFMGGNHDPGFDLLEGENLNGITIQKRDVYETPQGQRFQVEHGQDFDIWFGKDYSDWVSYHACRALDGALKYDFHIGRNVPSLRDAYILTNALKGLAKKVGVVKPFRKNAVASAVSNGLDGVISGHIHKFDIREVAADKAKSAGRNILYLNTGDGLTHGNSLAYSEDSGWIKVRHRDLPQGDAAAVLEHVNPLERFRGQTMGFLQKAWDAHLSGLGAAVSCKAGIEVMPVEAVVEVVEKHIAAAVTPPSVSPGIA